MTTPTTGNRGSSSEAAHGDGFQLWPGPECVDERFAGSIIHGSTGRVGALQLPGMGTANFNIGCSSIIIYPFVGWWVMTCYDPLKLAELQHDLCWEYHWLRR